MKTKPDLSFMDRVHDWTFLKRTFQGDPLSREVQAVQARLRAKLRHAQRFIVDDDAIAITAGLSREFKRLEAWSFLSRLPYDCMFLQFNLWHKVESLRALDNPPLMEPVDDRTSKILGYLLFRDTDGPSPVWVAHEFYQNNEGHPYIGMLAYVFDPEGDTMWPIRGSKFWHSPTLSLRRGFPRLPIRIIANQTADNMKGKSIWCEAAPEIALCGVYDPVGDSAPTYEDEKGDLHIEGDYLTAPPWFVNRGAVIIDPWWDNFFAARWRDDPDRVHRVISHEMNECRGAMKFLIALLGAINGLPRDVRPIVTRTGKRPVGMHMLPYLGHSHLKLTIPRDNRVIYRRMDHATGVAQTRRQHYVRGHWRVVERGKRVTFLCRHMPTMVENGLGMCENCEMLIRWIPQALRGDPEKGMVDHEFYDVTTKKAS
jgi:hypothetical protein